MGWVEGKVEDTVTSAPLEGAEVVLIDLDGKEVLRAQRLGRQLLFPRAPDRRVAAATRKDGLPVDARFELRGRFWVADDQ